MRKCGRVPTGRKDPVAFSGFGDIKNTYSYFLFLDGFFFAYFARVWVQKRIVNHKIVSTVMLCVTLEARRNNKAGARRVEPVFMSLLLANTNTLHGSLFFRSISLRILCCVLQIGPLNKRLLRRFEIFKPHRLGHRLLYPNAENCF